MSSNASLGRSASDGSVAGLDDSKKRARSSAPVGVYQQKPGMSAWRIAESRERSGKVSFYRLSDVPKGLTNAVDSQFQRIPSLVLRLQEKCHLYMSKQCSRGVACKGKHGPKRKIDSNIVEDIDWLISESLRVVCAPLEDAGTLDPGLLKPEQACQFTACGGGRLLADFLMCTMPMSLHGRGPEQSWLHDPIGPTTEAERKVHEMWFRALELLRELCLCSQGFNEELALDKEFVIFLFNVLRVSILFEGALILCEEVVCAQTREAFDLSLVPNLEEILDKLNANELTMVCRVLVLLVHEAEDPSTMSEPPTSMTLLRTRARALNTNSIVHRNQRLLASKPNVLRRLVHVLRRWAPRFPGEEPDRGETGYMTYAEITSALQDHNVYTGTLNFFRQLGLGHMDYFAALRSFMMDPVDQIIAALRMLYEGYNVRDLLGENEWQNMPAPLDMDKIAVIVEESLSGARNEPRAQRIANQAIADDREAVETRLASLEAALESDAPGSTEASEASTERDAGASSGTRDERSIQRLQAARSLSPQISRLLRSIGNLSEEDAPFPDEEDGIDEAEDRNLDEVSLQDVVAEAAGFVGGFDTGDNRRAAAAAAARADLGVAERTGAAEMDEDVVEQQRIMTERLRLEHVSKQVEVLFMLAMLAGSVRKGSVNHDLAKFNIVGMLSRLFHKLPWDTNDDESSHQRLHGANCQCKPMATIKIQYLRLVHNFCDREAAGRTNKRLLLSTHDLRVCQLLYRHDDAISMELTRQLLQDNGGRDAEDPKHAGLLYKLTRVMMKEDPNSQHRSWIASTLEAYMRSSTLEEQLLFSAWDVTSHVLEQMLQPGFKGPGMLQANFDLLGELLKFNRVQFAYVEKLLGSDRVLALMRLAVTHLIDSNVFLRTVILSIDFFSQSDPNAEQEFTMGRFLREHRVTILQSLMTVVELETASQENMCCLNTSLLILMIAHQNGKLTQYLQAVEELEPSHREKLVASWGSTTADDADAREANNLNSGPKEASNGDGDAPAAAATAAAADPEMSDAKDEELVGSEQSSPTAAFRAQGSPALVNFRRLLWFWRLYYSQTGGVDSDSLAAASTIPFSKWMNIVNLLCKDDGSPTSLLRKDQSIQVPSLLDLLSIY